MVLRADKERVQALVAETVTLLCKNGLTFKTEFCIEALVGITLDQDNEFHFSIKQTVKSDRALEEEEEQQQREEEEAAEAEISAVQDSKKPLEVLVHSRKSAGAGRRKVALEAVSGASPATTVSGGEVAEDLPSLTFETGEGSGDYWSSVAGHEGGHTPNNRGAKRKSSAAHAEYAQHKRSQVNRNSTPDAEGHSDTNSDLVVIKDEPADDDDDATGYSYDDTGNSGQYDASVFRNIASGDSRVEQVSMQAAGGVPWDQIASFSGDAGTAVGPDGQPLDPQQALAIRSLQRLAHGATPRLWRPCGGADPRADPKADPQADTKVDTKAEPSADPDLSGSRGGGGGARAEPPVIDDWTIARKILLAKGRNITPRQCHMKCFSSKLRPAYGRVKVIMQSLYEQGYGKSFGSIDPDELSLKVNKFAFIKKPPEEVAALLPNYTIPLEDYVKSYNSPDYDTHRTSLKSHE